MEQLNVLSGKSCIFKNIYQIHWPGYGNQGERRKTENQSHKEGLASFTSENVLEREGMRTCVLFP